MVKFLHIPFSYLYVLHWEMSCHVYGHLFIIFLKLILFTYMYECVCGVRIVCVRVVCVCVVYVCMRVVCVCVIAAHMHIQVYILLHVYHSLPYSGARLVASGPRVFVSTPHSAGVEGTRATTPSFPVGTRDFNSGLQAYEVSTLTHWPLCLASPHFFNWHITLRMYEVKCIFLFHLSTEKWQI